MMCTAEKDVKLTFPLQLFTRHSPPPNLKETWLSHRRILKMKINIFKREVIVGPNIFADGLPQSISIFASLRKYKHYKICLELFYAVLNKLHTWIEAAILPVRGASKHYTFELRQPSVAF